jgi:SAM-dependent methyltransferase
VEGVVSQSAAVPTVVAREEATTSARATPRCRFCGGALDEVVADLGVSPLANSYLEPEQLWAPETFYPLCARLCAECWLVQLPAVTSGEAIFSDYAYFSSYSESWLAHARRYVEGAVARFGLGSGSLVIEVASNDGYLLQYLKQCGVPVLGIEPARNVAAVAQERGIPTLSRFLGQEVARGIVSATIDLGAIDAGTSSAAPLLGRAADLVVANNVFAHVPALNDFTAGLRALLASRGALSIEVPHLQRLLEEGQFDTIYHEHFSYYSLHAAQRVLAAHGLVVFDVEELTTHGGSLRLWCRRDDAPDAASDKTESRLAATESVERVLAAERAAGLLDVATYRRFSTRVQRIKRELLRFLIDAKEQGKRVMAYGAPAKGNTLLNYCGIGTDLIELTVDLSPHKQGRYLPGTRIPIAAPDRLLAERPDYVLILPWNLRDEIVAQMAAIRKWGGRFVVAVPELTIIA